MNHANVPNPTRAAVRVRVNALLPRMRPDAPCTGGV
jgi:hypothetical protein